MQRVQITTLQRGQLCVYCQDVSVNQRLVISRVDARHWELARALWTGGQWVTQELIATYPAQAVALVQAGAWFERVAYTFRVFVVLLDHANGKITRGYSPTEAEEGPIRPMH